MYKILSLAFLTLALLMSACVNTPQPGGANNSGSTTTAKKDPNRKIKIGFAMDTLKEERWNRDKELFEKHCQEVGVECETSVANNDSARQANQVDDLLTKGIDVLVIVPNNAQLAADMVAKAKKQGVPVISYDRLVKSDELDAYVSHQAVRIGEMQAEYALKKAPKGNYIMVYGASTDNNALILKDAQLRILKPAIDKGDIKIVAENHATDWKPEEALKIVENALTQNKNDVVAVVASNDGTAGGAVQALEAQKLTGKVIVTGQDAEIGAMQRIAEGKQTMTIYKPIQPLAYGAVDAAIKLAKGEPLNAKDKIKVVNKEIPAILYEPQVTDVENIMTTVVKDGYHKCEDVYKNVPNNPCGK
jgi:D-xylose transport system substrate-binding protein